MGSEATIAFECPDCGRTMEADRNDDPPTAVKGMLQCDRCSDGDFHSIEYLDADGKWVDPVAHLAQPATPHA